MVDRPTADRQTDTHTHIQRAREREREQNIQSLSGNISDCVKCPLFHFKQLFCFFCITLHQDYSLVPGVRQGELRQKVENSFM